MEYRNGSVVMGNWHIVRKIGEGSYGSVYEIEKTDHGVTTKSALKVIRIPRSYSEIVTARYQSRDEKTVTSYFQGYVDEIIKEIAIMSELKTHANIVSYEDHSVVAHEGTIGWDILIRMELLIPLQEYILLNNVNEKDVIRLGKELCQALAFCQKKKLIHRDIKPGNIFANEEGQFKLGDFGIAKRIDKTAGGMSLKGTENYMAPEVYGGKYGQSVDIYSVGLVLYELMNNRCLPFCTPVSGIVSHDEREAAHEKRMRGEEAIPAPANASKGFAEVILKACAHNPQERYHSAAEMLEALENIDVKTINKNSLEKRDVELKEPVSEKEDDKTARLFYGKEKNDEKVDIPEKKPESSPKTVDKPKNEEVPPQNTTQKGFQYYYADEKKENLTKETQSRKKNGLIAVVAILLVIALITWLGIADKKEKEEAKLREYEALLDEAYQCTEEGKYALAAEHYEEAIKLDPSEVLAYYNMYSMYYDNGKYADAIKWLKELKEENPDAPIATQSRLDECWAGRVQYLIKNKKYKTLLSEFNEHSDEIPSTGSFVDKVYSTEVKDGKGLIFYAEGVYYGNIKNGQKSGKGVLFGTDNGTSEWYCVVDSDWKQDKANGEFVFDVANVDDSSENYTYSGKIKDNMFNGTIYKKQKCNDGVKRKFKGSAKNGTFKCIRQDDDKNYVYMEGVSSDWYLYMSEKSGLENNGVWVAY